MAGECRRTDEFPEGWELQRVADFAKVKGGKRLPSGTALTDRRTSHPYIRIVDFKDGQIDQSNLMFVPDDVFPRISRYTISSQDVWISIVGTVGLVGLVDQSLDGANLTENAAKICEIAPYVDKTFLSLFLRSQAGSEQIRAQTVGSTQPKLALFRIGDILVPLPPLAEQCAIAHILGTLDDKIELNRRRNQTLEAMARALFKDWFIDFGPVRAKMEGREPYLPADLWQLFPDRLDDEGKPEGWREVVAEEVADIGIGKTPPRKESQWFSTSETDMHWVSIRDMGVSGVFLQRTSEFLTREAVNKFNVRVVPDNTVILSFKLTVGRVAITDGEMVTNEAIAHLKVRNDSGLSSEYLYSYLREFDYGRLGSTSSIATAVNSKSIKALPVLVPGSDLARHFVRQVLPIFARIKHLQSESSILAKLRDTLLPKLISGELRIQDAERFMEERAL